MMLDAKRTFDEVIDRLAPDAATRDQILANRIYQQLSGAVAGTQEFTAMAKLFELHDEGDWDLLVLDTPPSRNALDFLDAPDRLTDFLEGRALQVFLRPAGFASKIVGKGTGLIFSILGRVTGTDLLSDLSVFFQSLGGVLEGFRERAGLVKGLLSDPSTTFVLVSSPEREPVEEAIFFAEKLAAARMPLGGVVVNRVHHDTLAGEEPADVEDELGTEIEPALARRAAANLRDFHVLAERDAAGIARLRKAVGRRVPLIAVPHFDDDVHDVRGLERMRDWLFAGDDERAEMLAAATA
jgi:anion-transporting  ArsA/GET3 family ATPase